MSCRPPNSRHSHCPHRRPAGLVMKPSEIPTRSLEQALPGREEAEALPLCEGCGFGQAEARQSMHFSVAACSAWCPVVAKNGSVPPLKGRSLSSAMKKAER